MREVGRCWKVERDVGGWEGIWSNCEYKTLVIKMEFSPWFLHAVSNEKDKRPQNEATLMMHYDLLFLSCSPSPQLCAHNKAGS